MDESDTQPCGLTATTRRSAGRISSVGAGAYRGRADWMRCWVPRRREAICHISGTWVDGSRRGLDSAARNRCLPLRSRRAREAARGPFLRRPSHSDLTAGSVFLAQDREGKRATSRALHLPGTVWRGRSSLTDLFEDILSHILPGGSILVKAVEQLFGDSAKTSHPFPNVQAVPPQPVSQPPEGHTKLLEAADEAAQTYQQAGGAVSATDVKLVKLIQQIVSSNEAARTKVLGSVAQIETMRQVFEANPDLFSDPHAVKGFFELVDTRLGEIQQTLEQAKVDGADQAKLLKALTDEYRSTAGAADQHSTKDISETKTDKPSDTTGGAGGGQPSGGGPQPTGGPAAAGDPLAGLPGGLGGMGDPTSMLGPALAGLGSIPSALGGLASSLPEAAMGMAPLAGQMAGAAGAGDGFKDQAGRDGAKQADFVDDHHDKDDKKPDDAGADEHPDADKKGAAAVPVAATTPAAPGAAVPASAGGDPTTIVQMPDGSPVTAPSGQHATAMRAVLNGSSVTDAWKAANVALPPPGTPVTEPADPSHLAPGSIAQFKTRDPVMYMGNGKISLDGQLQPQSALPTTDFLGWVDPAKQAGASAVTARSPGTVT